MERLKADGPRPRRSRCKINMRPCSQVLRCRKPLDLRVRKQVAVRSQEGKAMLLQDARRVTGTRSL